MQNTDFADKRTIYSFRMKDRMKRFQAAHGVDFAGAALFCAPLRRRFSRAGVYVLTMKPFEAILNPIHNAPGVPGFIVALYQIAGQNRNLTTAA